MTASGKNDLSWAMTWPICMPVSSCDRWITSITRACSDVSPESATTAARVAVAPKSMLPAPGFCEEEDHTRGDCEIVNKYFESVSKNKKWMNKSMTYPWSTAVSDAHVIVEDSEEVVCELVGVGNWGNAEGNQCARALDNLDVPNDLHIHSLPAFRSVARDGLVLGI
jgi:hypothetical protein